MRHRRRDARGLHVGVEREGVHQRALAAGGAVGGTEVADERRRRVRRPRAAWTVGPARGERAAEDPDAGIGGLDRVVAAGEQVRVAHRCEVRPSGAELRLPERVEVRLVADDHRAEPGKGLHERGAVGGEIRALGGGSRRVAREPVPGHHEELHVGPLRRGGNVAERMQEVSVRTALAPLPGRRDDRGAEARVAGGVHLRLREAAALLRQRVVDDPDHERSAALALGPGRRGKSQRARVDGCRRAAGRRGGAGRRGRAARGAGARGRGRADAPVVAGAAGFFSPPDETTTATTTPATAATATAAASRAFFTGSEATLARPCQNRSKTS